MTDLPFSRLVTRTQLGSGKVVWAADIAFMLNVSPLGGLVTMMIFPVIGSKSGFVIVRVAVRNIADTTHRIGAADFTSISNTAARRV